MRLFVALELPHATRQRLADLATQLPGARWVPPENFHITLRFIGEVPRHVAEELDLALAALRGRRFPLTLAGVGAAERAGHARALCACVERNPALEGLRAKIERGLQSAGLEPERRRFTPHVSLARIEQPSLDQPGFDRPSLNRPSLNRAVEPRLAQWVAKWVQAHNLFRAEPIEVTHFTLFSSQLGREQAVYTREVTYALD
jgi:2'-5' RNA ligase